MDNLFIIPYYQNHQISLPTKYIPSPSISPFSISRLKTLSATIQGEISEVKYSQKAVYFSLRDKGKSTIQCLIWLSRLTSLGVEPKDGLEVKVQGYPDVYPQYGKLTFKVDVITPVGEGALRLAFRETEDRARGAGVFPARSTNSDTRLCALCRSNNLRNRGRVSRLHPRPRQPGYQAVFL